MKKNNIFFDLWGIFTILGFVIWLAIVTYYLIAGTTLYWLSTYGLASFLLALICIVIAVIISAVKCIKNRRKR